MNECINANWDVRTLQRQKKSLLYERVMLNSNEEKKRVVTCKGDYIVNSKDLVKNPYILEFLDISGSYKESDLETSILKHLKEFMIEMGKGFSFVGSQVPIKCEEETFYVDLVLYNITVKCFVLIDLKIGRIMHRDIGQMEMYVSYYDKEVRGKLENPTIGILLGKTKNKASVRYMIDESNKNIFASIYKLNFPTKEELIRIIEE